MKRMNIIEYLIYTFRSNLQLNDIKYYSIHCITDCYKIKPTCLIMIIEKTSHAMKF